MFTLFSLYSRVLEWDWRQMRIECHQPVRIASILPGRNTEHHFADLIDATNERLRATLYLTLGFGLFSTAHILHHCTACNATSTRSVRITMFKCMHIHTLQNNNKFKPFTFDHCNKCKTIQVACSEPVLIFCAAVWCADAFLFWHNYFDEITLSLPY